MTSPTHHESRTLNNSRWYSAFAWPWRYPSLALVFLVLSFVASYCLINTDVAKHAKLEQNSIVVSFLASEMKTEVSPAVKAKQVHARILAEYVSAMQKKAPFIYVLFPEYSPKARLKEAIEALARCDESEESSHTALNLAAEVLLRTSEDWKRAGGSSTIIDCSRSTAKKAVEELLATFRNQNSEFASRPEIERAELACMGSRLFSAALVANWSEIDPKDRGHFVDQFSAQVSLLKTNYSQFAKENPTEAGTIENYSANVDRRLRLFSTLRTGGIPAGREFIRNELAKR